MLYLTWDDARDQQTRKLHIAYAQLGQMALDEGTIDWVLPPGAWIRVLRANGFRSRGSRRAVPREDASTTYLDSRRPSGAALAGRVDLEGAAALSVDARTIETTAIGRATTSSSALYSRSVPVLECTINMTSVEPEDTTSRCAL